MEQILLPTIIEFLESDDPNMGKVVITPCHQGYGTTIGNALRRVLLSSLPGAAVESVKIDGVQHEFSALTGVQEDVVEILLNLKQLAVRSFSDAPVKLSLTKKGVVDIVAADFDKNADIEIVNPNLKIATLTDKNVEVQMEITIGRGRGYVPASEKDTRGCDLGTIAIDSLYTPIRDVGYDVEMTRVGDVTDYEKLTVTVATNGTLTPKTAIHQAVRILIDHFTLLSEVAGDEETSVSSGPMSSADEEITEGGTVGEEVEEVKKTSKKKKSSKQ